MVSRTTSLLDSLHTTKTVASYSTATEILCERAEPGISLSNTTVMIHGAPALVLAQHLGRNLRFKGSPLRDRPRSNSCRHQCRSRRVRFSDSEQWSSPVKPPRSQNYVKPHNARTRVHVAISRLITAWARKQHRAGVRGCARADAPR